MPISKAQIKYLQSLKLKKYRLRYNKFIVEGDKMVREAMRDIPERIVSIYARADWDGLSQVPHSLQEKCYHVNSTELERISLQKEPNQVLAELELGLKTPDEAAVAKGLSLYLDRTQDPGNLGTIIRIADWFGIAAIFLSPDTVEPYNPKVVQSTMGSFWRVPMESISIESLQQRYPTLSLVGSSLSGKPLDQWEAKSGSLLIIGNESKGMSAEMTAACSELLLIPGDNNSLAESLNAAVSTGILCSYWSISAGSRE